MNPILGGVRLLPEAPELETCPRLPLLFLLNDRFGHGPRSGLSVEGESTSGSCSTSRNNHIGLSVAQVRMASLAVSLMVAPMSIPQI